jgi:hypothetical protein
MEVSRASEDWAGENSAVAIPWRIGLHDYDDCLARRARLCDFYLWRWRWRVRIGARHHFAQDAIRVTAHARDGRPAHHLHLELLGTSGRHRPNQRRYKSCNNRGRGTSNNRKRCRHDEPPTPSLPRGKGSGAGCQMTGSFGAFCAEARPACPRRDAADPPSVHGADSCRTTRKTRRLSCPNYCVLMVMSVSE